MTAPTLPERMDRIEDEVAGLESMIDARTRTLWAEVVKLQAQVKELQEMNAQFKGIARNSARFKDEK